MAKLTYRGVSYNISPTSNDLYQSSPEDALESSTAIEHLSPSANLAAKDSLPVPQPVQRLTYRGVNYYQTVPQPSLGRVDLQPADRSAASQPHQAVPMPVLGGRSSSFRPTPPARFIESTERANVFEYLQNRLKAAKIQGDQALVAVIQREMQLLF